MTSFEDENEFMPAADVTNEGEPASATADEAKEGEPTPAMAAERDLQQAKRGVAVLATCIVQILNECDPCFRDRFLARLQDAYYEIRENYDRRWTDRSVKQELELLSWTRELLTGWNFVTGQGKPFLER